MDSIYYHPGIYFAKLKNYNLMLSSLCCDVKDAITFNRMYSGKWFNAIHHEYEAVKVHELYMRQSLQVYTHYLICMI